MALKRKIEQLQYALEKSNFEIRQRQNHFDRLVSGHEELVMIARGRKLALLQLEADIVEIDRRSFEYSLRTDRYPDNKQDPFIWGAADLFHEEDIAEVDTTHPVLIGKSLWESNNDN